MSNVLLEHSLINCSAEGVDSLVLKEGPGKIRMFVARPEHTLWKNYVGGTHNYPPLPFSIPIHRHPFDTTLMPVCGDIFNVFVDDSNDEDYSNTTRVYPYRYIPHPKAFKPLDLIGTNLNLRMRQITKPTFMPANDLHTMYVPKGTVAAWYIWEQAKIGNLDGAVYTTDPNIENFDFGKMDLPMTVQRLREDLSLIEVFT